MSVNLYHNEVTFTGVIVAISPVYQERFGILQHRLQVSVKRFDKKDHAIKSDLLGVAVLFDRNIKEKFAVGDTVRFTGELVTNLYELKPTEATPEIIHAVANYIEIFEELPVMNINKSGGSMSKGYRLDFDELINTGFLSIVPNDANYKGQVSTDGPLETYKIKQDGTVYKVIEQLNYIVYVDSKFEKIEPLQDDELDISICNMKGKVIFKPTYTNIGQYKKLVKMVIEVTASSFKKSNYTYRFTVKYLDSAKNITKWNIQQGDIIHFTGDVSTFSKEILRGVNVKQAGGKKKRKEQRIYEYHREFHVKKMIAVTKGTSKHGTQQ